MPFTKQKTVEFNPNSRKHIEYNLRKKYDWKLQVFTLQGDAKIDETILASLPFEEAKKLAPSFMLQKRIRQLAEGKNAWMRLVDDDGKLRHTINPTELSQAGPATLAPTWAKCQLLRAPYGGECRQLFQPAPRLHVGADLSGLELRCLAGFLHQIDGGAYAKVVLEGDIHQTNADMVGIDRAQREDDDLRTLLREATLVWGKSLIRPQAGRALRQRFYKANPAFETLVRRVKNTAKNRGYLLGLDSVSCRSAQTMRP